MVRFLIGLISIVLLIGGCRKDDRFNYTFTAPSKIKVKGWKKEVTFPALWNTDDSLLFIADSIVHLGTKLDSLSFFYQDSLYEVTNGDTMLMKAKYLTIGKDNKIYIVKHNENTIKSFKLSNGVFKYEDELYGPAFLSISDTIHSFFIDSTSALYIVFQSSNITSVRLFQKVGGMYWEDPNSNILLEELNRYNSFYFPCLVNNKVIVGMRDEFLSISTRFRKEDPFESMSKTAIISPNIKGVNLFPDQKKLIYSDQLDGKHQLFTVRFSEN